MAYRLQFEVNKLPLTYNKFNSCHWIVRKKEADFWKDTVKTFVIASGCIPPSLDRATLTLTRFSSTEPDPDGLVFTFKYIIDGLVRAGVIKNDRYSNIGMPNYKWEKAKKSEGKISVLVEEHG